MDKERSEWVKKYRLDHGVSDQAARKAYLKHNQNTTVSMETQPKNTTKPENTTKTQPEKSTKTQPSKAARESYRLLVNRTEVVCPTCKGTGRVPISSKPKERELTGLPRLLPRRL